MGKMTISEGIGETGRNVRAFTKENMDAFWYHLKPFLPWIVGLNFLDLVLQAFVFDSAQSIGIGNWLSYYFLTCFAITWHRVVLHGPENVTPVNPLRPEKTDLAFIGMGILLSIAFVIAGVLFVFLASLGPAMVLVFFVTFITMCLVFIRFSFYFPAKAVRSHVSLGESFHLTQGYVWKMIATPFMAMWRVFLLTYLIVIGGMIFLFAAFGIDPEESAEAFDPQFLLAMFLLMLPVLVFFQPLMYALGVGVLSNYYQHALQNKPAA